MKDWLLYSIVALMAWGVWGFLPKVALGYLDPAAAFVFEALGGALAGLFVMLIFRPQLVGAPIMGIIPAFFTGVLGYLGLIFFMYAVRQGEKLSIIAPITALYPAVTIALAMIFLKERLNFVQVTGILLALISIFLISYQ